MGDCHTLDDLNSVPGTHTAEGDSHELSSDLHSRAVAHVPAPNTWTDASRQKQVTNEHIIIINTHEGNASANYWRTSPHRLTPTIPTLNCRVVARIPGHWPRTAGKEANGATSKNGLAASYKVKHIHTIRPGSPTPWYYPQRNKNCSHINTCYTSIHVDSTHDHPNLETAQMYFSKQKSKQW